LPAWVCDPPPNGNVVHCTFSGGLAAGDQLPAIIVGVELLPQSPGPPSITNCADVSVYNEDDLSDNHSCVITTFSY
jgi:hypothetical protein